MNENQHTICLIKPTLGNRLGILLLTFIVMLIAVGLIKLVLDSIITDSRTAILASSVTQALFAFILPAWLAAYLCSHSAASYLGTNTPVASRQFLGVLILLVIMMPAMNSIVAWNENLSLPASMSALEQSMRSMEDAAAAMTDILLGDTTVWGFISGVLIVGILTGIAEETFFRAGLQKALASAGINHHVAIWTAAFIFSTIHFQFFGFVPRLLLGAAFGYIYHTTQPLWVAASAHALNNSIVVITAWLVNRGLMNADIEQIGVDGSGTTIWKWVSLAATLVFIACFWHKTFCAPSSRQLNISKQQLRTFKKENNG